MHAWLCVHICVCDVCTWFTFCYQVMHMSYHGTILTIWAGHSIASILWIGLYFFGDFYILNRVFQMNNFASA